MKMKSQWAKGARDGGRKRLNNIRSLIISLNSQTNISCNQFLVTALFCEINESLFVSATVCWGLCYLKLKAEPINILTDTDKV